MTSTKQGPFVHKRIGFEQMRKVFAPLLGQLRPKSDRFGRNRGAFDITRATWAKAWAASNKDGVVSTNVGPFRPNTL